MSKVYILIIIAIVGLGVAYYLYGNYFNKNQMQKVYKNDELKELVKFRSTRIEGIAKNGLDPYGVNVPIIEIIVSDSGEQSLVKVYLYNKTPWRNDELGMVVNLSGQLLYQVERTVDPQTMIGSDDFGYYQLKVLEDNNNLEIFSCNNLGFEFNHPHIGGWHEKDVKNDSSSCTVTYIWIGARDISQTEFSVKATVTDMVKKLAEPVLRNPSGFAYEERENGVIFYLPSKSVEIEIIDFPKEKTSVLNPSKTEYIGEMVKSFSAI